MGKGKRGKGEKPRAGKRRARVWALTGALGVVGGTVAVLGGLWWFSMKPHSSSPPAVARERIRYAMRDPVELTDPALVRTTENALWLAQVCEGLVRYRADSVDVEPALAESFSASENQKEWTFRLRKDVRFHDGTEFNARAVHFCFMRLMDPNNPYHISGMLATAREIFGDERQQESPCVKDIQTPDDFTVTINLTHPDSSFLRRLARVEASIMSPKAIQSAASDGQTTLVGTGPMRVKSLREGTGVVLERNPDYWGTGSALKEFEFRQVADANERERALREQLCEMAQRFSPPRVSELQRIRQLRVHRGPAVHGCAIILNRNIAPLDQPAVRKALAFSIDRVQLVASVLRGYGTPAENFVPPAIGEAPTTAVLSARADWDTARQLLHAIGLENGFALKLLVPKEERIWNPAGLAVGEALAADLRRVNISVLLEAASAEEVRRSIERGDFQAALWGLSSSSGDVVDYVQSFLRIAGAHAMDSAETHSQVSALLRDSRESDKHKRTTVHEELEKRFAEIMPWIPLFYADQVLVINRHIEGVMLQPLGMHRLSLIEWVQEAK